MRGIVSKARKASDGSLWQQAARPRCSLSHAAEPDLSGTTRSRCGSTLARPSATKGSAQEPYINHLLEVASLVAEATHGKDPDLVIAALFTMRSKIRKFLVSSSSASSVSEWLKSLAKSPTTKHCQKKNAKRLRSKRPAKKPTTPRSSSLPTRPATCAQLRSARRPIGR